MNLLVSLVLIPVTMTAWVSPAAGRGGSDPAAVAAARTRLLGPGWDEPGQVRLRWVDVTTFLVSFGGLVVKFDGWAIEGGVSGYAPVTVEDLIAARPEYIYAGHGHVDHMGHVDQIAEATGAKVVGTTEHCAVARSDASRPEAVSCVFVVDRQTREPFDGAKTFFPGVPPGRTPFGAGGVPAEGPPGLEVTVVLSKHSSPRPDPSNPQAPLGGPPDPEPVRTHPPKPEDLAHFAETLPSHEGGTLAYLFTYGDFSLLWHDSSGPVSSADEPGGDRIKAALESLGEVDVEIGAIAELNQMTRGLTDPREYIEAARPKVFMPIHHDNFLPPFTSSGHSYYRPLVEELAKIPAENRPDLCFITDPDSYFTIFRFVPAEWAGEAKAPVDGCVTPG